MFQARNYHFEHFSKFINQRTLDPQISRRVSWPRSSWVGLFSLWAGVSSPPLPLTCLRACGAISTYKGD